MPGLIDIHCHPTSQPLYKGIREELGNPRLYNSALYDGTAPFQTDDEGRRACAVYALGELLASGVTTIAELSAPYEGWWTSSMRAACARSSDRRTGRRAGS